MCDIVTALKWRYENVPGSNGLWSDEKYLYVVALVTAKSFNIKMEIAVLIFP